MESDMVSPFNNKRFLNSGKALELIESLFAKNLSGFSLKEKKDQGVFFYAIYSKKDIQIKFGGERGYFEHYIQIGNTTFLLSQYDERMKNVELASEKNIIFAFTVLIKFLSEKELI